MLPDAQPWVSAREVRAREMTWTTAERTLRGQPRGSGREWDRAVLAIGNLPREVARVGKRHILTARLRLWQGARTQESVDHDAGP